MGGLTQEQVLLKDSVRQLTKDKIAPRAAEIDEEGVFPRDIFELLAENELVGLYFPEEYGGGGSDLLTFALVEEEISKACNVSSGVLATQVLGSNNIVLAGNEDQKQRYLPELAAGRKICAFAVTEAGAGSDIASMLTRAERRGDYYYLSGTKCFISNADAADLIVVFAKTDPEAGARGISAFIVEKDFGGCFIGKVERKMGGQAIHACEVVFEECPVPVENLLGQEGGGLRLALTNLDYARPVMGARAVGLAQGALDYAIAYAKERVQFGQPIAGFQGLQFLLADMATHVEAARQLVYAACERVESGSPEERTKYGAMCKYFATDVAMRVTTDSVQVMGGYGYMKDYPLERMMREAKLGQIVEGTNQIQRIVVARSLVGKL